MPRAVLIPLALLLVSAAPKAAPASPSDADWPSYNRDALGSRHNPAEKALTAATVGGLVEKWRYPAKGSFTFPIGAVQATPVVVNGHVYFGTVTLPAVYKLGPDGRLKWSFKGRAATGPAKFGLPTEGFAASIAVGATLVYACDLGGTVYALDRATGKERWKLDTRNAPFPGAHGSNCLFASPVLIDGNRLLVAGGGFEHGLASDPKHDCCDGRGFVACLDAATGKTLWKYDVGEQPRVFPKPLVVKDDWGERTFTRGPSTSSVWSTPSHDPETGLIYFGTDAHNAPRYPTEDNPSLSTKHSCAVIAIDAKTGAERWVTQLTKGDLWNYGMRGYDSKTGLYKDQSVGDTPKPATIRVGGRPTRVVGVGCKNGGFYVLDAKTGKLVANTPVYAGPPTRQPGKARHPRTLAMPGLMGGIQTGCATDGKAFFVNGTDANLFGNLDSAEKRFQPPTGGRVTAVSLDLADEIWRHERPPVKAVGGTAAKPAFTDVGDPVASGVALAGGVAHFTTLVSNKLVAVDVASGKMLKEIALGPVWCGPSVSRGRVYVGTGNILFSPLDPKEAYFPKALTGSVICFGLPGEDEVSKMGKGDE